MIGSSHQLPIRVPSSGVAWQALKHTRTSGIAMSMTSDVITHAYMHVSVCADYEHKMQFRSDYWMLCCHPWLTRFDTPHVALTLVVFLAWPCVYSAKYTEDPELTSVGVVTCDILPRCNVAHHT